MCSHLRPQLIAPYLKIYTIHIYVNKHIIWPRVYQFKDYFVVTIFLFEFILENQILWSCRLFQCLLHYMTLLFCRPRELDFKYVMKVSSLKKSLPEAAFRKQNYLEQKGLFNCSDTQYVLSFVPVISPLTHSLSFLPSSLYPLLCPN